MHSLLWRESLLYIFARFEKYRSIDCCSSCVVSGNTLHRFLLIIFFFYTVADETAIQVLNSQSLRFLWVSIYCLATECRRKLLEKVIITRDEKMSKKKKDLKGEFVLHFFSPWQKWTNSLIKFIGLFGKCIKSPRHIVHIIT